MTEKIRVLQLIDGLNIGGAEVLLRDLCSGLLRRGFGVAVGYSTPGPIIQDLKNLGIEPVHLPRLARVDPLRYGPGLVRLIRSFRPHIVHTHLFKSDFHGRVAAALCKTPVIISTLHNNDPWARHWLFGPLYGLTARQAARLIAVSQEVNDYHARFSHIPAEKIITIPNGVDVDRFRFDPAARAQVRSSFGLDSAAPLVGIIGRLKPQKDHATFLTAAAETARLVPGARFLIVGDGPLRAELENMARGLGLDAAVIFCGLRGDIPAVLSALDVLVLSSRWEGLPINLLEGMAAGRAVVTTNVSGILDVVEPGVSAIVVEPGNPTALAQACVGLLKDANRRAEMGTAAVERVRARFSIQAMIDRTVEVYQAALREVSAGNPVRMRWGDV
jgi:glycosyltransferase involved in cell wall biosynthesis